YFPIYHSSWSHVPAAGGYDVTLTLEQRQSWQLFTMPVDVRISTTAGPRDFVVPDSLASFFRGHGLEVSWLGNNRKALGEIACVDAVARAGSRKILEATDLGELSIEAHLEAAALTLPMGTCFVRTDQPLGAIATYLCEAKSDDSLWVNALLPEPKAGDELPVFRLLEPLE
ncbi:MAG: hypothetical protein ABL998_10505, partial [Planctomycetota bacterium]